MDEGDDDRKPSAKPSPADDGHAAAAAAAAAPGSGSNTPGKKVKPALKKDHHHAASDEKKHLKWDEGVIEEHDMLRGTRMKIDEPNTPYTHYDSGAESDDSRRPKSPASQKATLSWDVLETRLNSVAAVRDQYPSSPPGEDGAAAAAGGAGGGDQSDADADAGQDGKKNEMRTLEFQEHRKRHYNEMELVRRFREEHPEGPLANGDDNNGNGNSDNNNNNNSSGNDDGAEADVEDD